MATERDAIEKLIRDVDSADKMRSEVPRRIFTLFAIALMLGFALFILAVRHGRRDRPIEDGPRRP